VPPISHGPDHILTTSKVCLAAGITVVTLTRPQMLLSEADVTAPSDGELAARLKCRDDDALCILYARFATPLLRLALRFLDSVDEAEDVVQDVFVGLPIALRHYEEHGAFGAWLRQVTVRTALMHRRSRERRHAHVALSPARREATTQDSVLERVALEGALATLPQALRDVFVLYHVEHFSHAEIAALLSIRRGTAEVRLHRAIRQLRKQLESDR
jgi:RNA polymerase sigma factor (sigma-70 family)